MKNTIQIQNVVNELGFTDILNNGVSDLHELEGSLWLDKTGNVCMFCQVGPHMFSMVVLAEGNRNIDSFCYGEYEDNVKDLKTYKRFKGTMKLTAN